MNITTWMFDQLVNAEEEIEQDSESLWALPKLAAKVVSALVAFIVFGWWLGPVIGISHDSGVVGGVVIFTFAVIFQYIWGMISYAPKGGDVVASRDR